jgi:hypothetical protein
MREQLLELKEALAKEIFNLEARLSKQILELKAKLVALKERLDVKPDETCSALDEAQDCLKADDAPPSDPRSDQFEWKTSAKATRIEAEGLPHRTVGASPEPAVHGDGTKRQRGQPKEAPTQALPIDLTGAADSAEPPNGCNAPLSPPSSAPTSASSRTWGGQPHQLICRRCGSANVSKYGPYRQPYSPKPIFRYRCRNCDYQGCPQIGDPSDDIFHRVAPQLQ